MKLNTFNLDLAVSTLAHVTEDESRWNQQIWSMLPTDAKMEKKETEEQNYFTRVSECGTTGCFAGWTEEIAGTEIAYDLVKVDSKEEELVTGLPLGTEYYSAGNVVSEVDGETKFRSIIWQAAEDLGIPHDAIHDAGCAHALYDDRGHMFITLMDALGIISCLDKCSKNPRNSYWDFRLGYPAIFAPDNTVEDLFTHVADMAGISTEEVHALVEAKREEFTASNAWAWDRNFTEEVATA